MHLCRQTAWWKSDFILPLRCITEDECSFAFYLEVFISPKHLGLVKLTTWEYIPLLCLHIGLQCNGVLSSIDLRAFHAAVNKYVNNFSIPNKYLLLISWYKYYTNFARILTLLWGSIISQSVENISGSFWAKILYGCPPHGTGEYPIQWQTRVMNVIMFTPTQTMETVKDIVLLLIIQNRQPATPNSASWSGVLVLYNMHSYLMVLQKCLIL